MKMALEAHPDVLDTLKASTPLKFNYNTRTFGLMILDFVSRGIDPKPLLKSIHQSQFEPKQKRKDQRSKEARSYLFEKLMKTVDRLLGLGGAPTEKEIVLCRFKSTRRQ
jgi:hypothetical protein